MYNIITQRRFLEYKHMKIKCVILDFWIRQYPYKSHIFRVIDIQLIISVIISPHNVSS